MRRRIPTSSGVCVNPPVVDAVIELLEAAPVPSFLSRVRASRRSDRACRGRATAVAHRDSTYSMVMLSSWDVPAETDRNVDWAHGAWNRAEPLTHGYYINTANADDARAACVRLAARTSTGSSRSSASRSGQSVPHEREHQVGRLSTARDNTE
jgi:hypothetical protein